MTKKPTRAEIEAARDEDLRQYEDMLIEQIKLIQERARQDAKPYIDRLIELRNLRPQKIYLTREQALAWCAEQEQKGE